MFDQFAGLFSHYKYNSFCNQILSTTTTTHRIFSCSSLTNQQQQLPDIAESVRILFPYALGMTTATTSSSTTTTTTGNNLLQNSLIQLSSNFGLTEFDLTTKLSLLKLLVTLTTVFPTITTTKIDSVDLTKEAISTWCINDDPTTTITTTLKEENINKYTYQYLDEVLENELSVKLLLSSGDSPAVVIVKDQSEEGTITITIIII